MARREARPHEIVPEHLRGGCRDWFRTILNEIFEPFPVRLEVGLFHLGRAGVIGEHLEEHLAERTHAMAADAGSHEVYPLGRIDPQIIELLEPHTMPYVVMARGHQRHLETWVLATGSRLGLECGCFGLLGKGGAGALRKLPGSLVPVGCQ